MNDMSMPVRHALPLRSVLAGAALAATLLGFGTMMAEPNSALNHARASDHAMHSDPQVGRFAAAELAQARDALTRFQALNAKRTERGLVITLDDALFDSDRAELPSGGLRDMAKLVEFFERHPTRTALIEGFTDSRGSKSANLDLSLRRAGALRHALIDQGVFAGRLETRGYGDAHPASTNSTAAGRRMNRRVEIVLSGDDGIVSAR
jgi:outer membrane protein OmpA-like peptidoglycan-associated protein